MRPHSAVAVNIDPAADNRIHDDDVARAYGFAGALVPGVELLALASAPLVQEWGADLLASGRMALRFHRPVYDGERVTVTTDDGLAVVGPDGTVRATGSCQGPAPRPAPPAYEDVPLPADPQEEPVALGTVHSRADPAACADYVARIGEPSPLYADLVHPGLLLRLVNLALMRSVALGAWIHTASDCTFHSPASVHEDLAVRSRVTGRRTTGKGHDLVTYDALVLAGDRPVVEVAHEAIWRLAPAPQGGPPPAR